MTARAITALASLALAACTSQPEPLRVCADPNNMPFSNRAGEGFENRIAEVIAADLKRPLHYVWWSQRRGFMRQTIGADLCDMWPGVASGLDSLATTRPYYRSTYVFVTRRSDDLAGLTLDDPRLRSLLVGIQLAGDEASNTPPADALARRRIIDNVRGYMVAGDSRNRSPARIMLDDVASGKIDVALIWGPAAGYFASRAQRPFRIEPIRPWLDGNRWPMAFDISVGVAKPQRDLMKKIDLVLNRHRNEVRSLLIGYGVPMNEHPLLE